MELWQVLILTSPIGVFVGAMLSVEVGIQLRRRGEREPTSRRLARLKRTAHRVEARRVKKLTPVEALLDFKAKRREEEMRDWMGEFRLLVPAPGQYDGQTQRLETYLFSGEKHLIRRAIDPPAAPKPEKKVAAKPVIVEQGEVVVRNAYGYVVYSSHNQVDFTEQLAAYNQRHPKKPFDGKHYTTCPYECDCPKEFRLAP